jgi:hypothetical protein
MAPDNPERLYAPGVAFHKLRVPMTEMAGELNKDAFMSGKALENMPYTHFKDQRDEGMDVIAFPMTGDSFLKAGVHLLDFLYSLVAGESRSADEPDFVGQHLNYFLLMYKDGQRPEGSPAPAAAIYPGLYVSDDDGATWVTINQMVLVTTRASAAN